MWGRWGMQPEGQVQGLLSSVSPAPCKDLGRVGLVQVPSEQSRTEVRLCFCPFGLPVQCSLGFTIPICLSVLCVERALGSGTRRLQAPGAVVGKGVRLGQGVRC